MQGRSRMAAFALAAGVALGFGSASWTSAEDKLVLKKLNVELRVTGLTARGCKVDVKPGHAGCKFAPLLDATVRADGKLSVELKDVEIRSADRDCSIAVTIREEGQADRTTHRGFRVPAAADGRPAPDPTMTCFLSSPSKLAKAEAERTRR